MSMVKKEQNDPWSKRIGFKNFSFKSKVKATVKLSNGV